MQQELTALVESVFHEAQRALEAVIDSNAMAIATRAEAARDELEQAQEELEALQRVTKTCDRELAKAKRYSRTMAQEREKTVTELLKESKEVVEGVRTLKVAHMLAQKHKLHLPIMSIIYKIVYEDFEISNAIEYLMSYPYTADVDF